MPFDRRIRPRQTERRPLRPGRPRGEELEDFGSNQQRQAELRQQSEGQTGERTQDAGAGASPYLAIFRTLRVGSEGEDVKLLQRFLGLEGDDVDGDFGSGTKGLVVAWQEDNGLKGDGVVGTGTIAKMRGDEEIYGYSKYQHPDRFVPDFPMMAYHESGSYREQADPYAVGAVTNPDKDDDLGGKTYGVYQFETFVHAGGDSDTDAAKGSTAMRFIKWSKNPYGKQLQAVVDSHGLASDEFDAAWKKLAREENKAFGKAQQDFLRHDKGAKVGAWMKRAQVADSVAGDDAFFDLVLGTLNHVGTLADGAADHLAALRTTKERDLTVEEAATALADYKLGRVEGWFTSSPDAQPGIRSRFEAEKAAFASQ